MDPSNDRMLARIWADAPLLSQFIEERAEQLCLEAAPTPGRKMRRVARKLSTIEGMTVLMEAHRNLNLARGKAQKKTINDLTAGRLVALGRQTDSHLIEIVDDSFWIGAQVQGDTVSRDGVKLIEVRLVPPDALSGRAPERTAGTKDIDDGGCDSRSDFRLRQG